MTKITKIDKPKNEGVLYDALFQESIQGNLLWVRVIVQKPPSGIGEYSSIANSVALELTGEKMTLKEEINNSLAVIGAMLTEDLTDQLIQQPTSEEIQQSGR
ncbi:MAG: hypothetical protein ABFC84_16505 [Veillonellales bacterium]